MSELFKPIPCGETLPPQNVHAVSVSIPTFSDVIDYGEKRSTCIKSGYPRFVLHPYLRRVSDHLHVKYDLHVNEEVVLVSSRRFASPICARYNIKERTFEEDFGIVVVDKTLEVFKEVQLYIQYVGCNLSSRFGEDYLFAQGLIETKQEEMREEGQNAQEIITHTLAEAYKEPKANIALAPSGMNCIYGAVKGLQGICPERKRVVQLGWLYRDTMGIVSDHCVASKTFYDVMDLDAVASYLEKEGKDVLCLITEVPTNPLVQCADMKRLRALCDTYGIALVIDSTFGTAYNLDLKPYADVYVESLTKFACGHADVMMGALIINDTMPVSDKKEHFFAHLDTPYLEDMRRLAYEIQGYKERIARINANTKSLVAYLQKQPFIDEVFYSLNPKNKDNYAMLMRHPDALGGVISVTFTENFMHCYDTLNFPKGPSLGTEFTLAMPYVYLAHYGMINDEVGRILLKENNIPIELLRISVGVEPLEEIIHEFEKLNFIS